MQTLLYMASVQALLAVTKLKIIKILLLLLLFTYSKVDIFMHSVRKK